MKNILLVVCFAGLALAQNKKADPAAKKTAPAAATKPAPATAIVIPADAVEIEPGLFQAKDDKGKVWHYTRTPFGVRKFEPQPVIDTTAEEAARISVTGEENGVIRFSRKTPFGSASWSKPKDKLNAAEKMAVEHAAKQKDASGTSATAKPSN
jgi:hypothetical protein